MDFGDNSDGSGLVALRPNRELVSQMVDEDTRIGGEGIVVEIDESKFGKRKYNRGHRVDDVWILGGVERTAE